MVVKRILKNRQNELNTRKQRSAAIYIEQVSICRTWNNIAIGIAVIAGHLLANNLLDI